MSILERSKKIFSQHTTCIISRKKYSDIIKRDVADGLLIKNNYSRNLEELYFTNFLSEEGSIDAKRFLDDLKQKCLKSDIINDKDFEIIFFDGLNKNGIDRLLKIINSYDDTLIKSETELIKCKFKDNPEYQLYITKNATDNIFEIVLIDLYHLGILARLGNIPYNPMRIYNKHKNKKYDIINILTDNTN